MELISIVKEIKKKKELRGLADNIVEDALNFVLKSNGMTLHKLQELSSRDLKIILKEVRLRLRLAHGRFQISYKDKSGLLEKEGEKKLLETHSSTKERLGDYSMIKSLLSSLNVKSILDLGCGMNPIALASSQAEYFASDINEEELTLINKYFRENHIRGRAFFFNLEKSDISLLPKSDICLILKVLDILNGKRKIAFELLAKCRCNYFLVSFPTKKLSGKPMGSPKRKWFESIVTHFTYEYKTFETKSEIFYLIKKA